MLDVVDDKEEMFDLGLAVGTIIFWFDCGIGAMALALVLGAIGRSGTNLLDESVAVDEGCAA